MQGLEVKVTVEDINELFNFLDNESRNRIQKKGFVNGISYITQRMGGSGLDSLTGKGVIQAKKGITNTQQIFAILKIVTDGIQEQKLNIRQLLTSLDINNTGYLTRSEFIHVCKQLCESLKLEQIRILQSYLDDKNLGKISIIEFLRLVQELLNQQIGGGVFAFMQVQPVIKKIINELSIDCDRFFDEVADKNEEIAQAEQRKIQQQISKARSANTAAELKGLEGAGGSSEESAAPKASSEGTVEATLYKSVFFNHLNQYGVFLAEHEKALISTVFSLNGNKASKLDYQKLDQAFEGQQQALYANGKFAFVLFKRNCLYFVCSNLSCNLFWL